MSVIKRQREVKKAEKAAQKRARRHGAKEEVFAEPQPTVRLSDVDSSPDAEDESDEKD
ncbi:MAG: hypothetical protein GTO33_14855 [Acidobacteria bacterium]|nr:hypothetical protein [Acidobacteriota bacterium]